MNRLTERKYTVTVDRLTPDHQRIIRVEVHEVASFADAVALLREIIKQDHVGTVEIMGNVNP